MKKVAKSFFIVTLVLLLVSVVRAQEVVEKFKLRNNIEALTYINSGAHMGKFAVVDEWWVFSLDLDTQRYEKLFNCEKFGFAVFSRGICHMSTGDYAGNFLLNDAQNSDTLFVVSESGELITEVTAADFSWNAHCEDITEITSGIFQGNFAMICFTDPGFVPHIYIFSIVNESGTAKAYLQHDIQNSQLGSWPLGLTFLPDDYPNPELRNHFVTADYIIDSGAPYKYLRVIDYQGNMVESHPAEDYFEGFSYISSGSKQGNFIASDSYGKSSRLQSLDGSYQEDITSFMSLGFGFNSSWMLSWIDKLNGFRLNEFLDSGDTIRNIARDSQGNWSIDYMQYDHGLSYVMDTTKLTNDEKYYLVGFTLVGNIREFVVQKRDKNFQLEETYPLYVDHPGKRFSRICYIPGKNPSEDKFAFVQYYDEIQRVSESNIYFFDLNFSEPPEIIHYSEGVNSKSDIVYDPSISRFFLKDASDIVRVYNKSWEQMAQYDISHLTHPAWNGDLAFVGMTKITSGELKGNFALLNRTTMELIIINITPQLMTAETQTLIANISNSDIQDNTVVRLTQKLDNVIKAIEKGNTNTAINILGAFQNQVNAQSGKKIPEELADTWLEYSEILINYLTE